MKRPSVLINACLFIICLTGAAAAQGPGPARIAAFTDSAVAAAMAQTRTPGISVAVVRGTDTLVLKGYGFADVENRVTVSPETVFRVGSLTKQFTAAAVMKLVEEGKLRLDGTIAEYLPDYTGPGKTVTIHQLLNHTSGIPSYTALGEKFWGRSRLDLTHTQMLELFAADPLQFEPGSRFAYNNSGYYLLGVIIEKVTGHSYADHIHATIAAPQRLETVRYCHEKTIVANRADGYAYENGVLMNDPPISMDLPFAAGALCSNARDLVRWNTLLANGRIVTAGSYAKMTTPTTLTGGTAEQYGYGLQPGRLGPHASVEHSGGINGFTSYMAYYPAQQLTVVVLGNMGSDAPGQLTGAIARFILGVAAPPPVAAEAPAKDLLLTAAERAPYLGTYDLAPLAPLQIRVFEQGERLIGQATGQGPIPLRYQGDHTFVGPDGAGIRMVFELVGGKATQFTLHQGGRSGVARRIQD